MAHIIFYEKPGCVNNTKQKTWLEAAGHTIEAHSILEHPWTPQTLLPFMRGGEPANWFNRTAPVIKAGKLDPEHFSANQAVAAMIVTPILIKRPLMQIGILKLQGFDKEEIERLVGLQAIPGQEAMVEQLDADNLTLCPKLADPCDCDRD